MAWAFPYCSKPQLRLRQHPINMVINFNSHAMMIAFIQLSQNSLGWHRMKPNILRIAICPWAQNISVLSLRAPILLGLCHEVPCKPRCRIMIDMFILTSRLMRWYLGKLLASSFHRSSLRNPWLQCAKHVNFDMDRYIANISYMGFQINLYEHTLQ